MVHSGQVQCNWIGETSEAGKGVKALKDTEYPRQGATLRHSSAM